MEPTWRKAPDGTVVRSRSVALCRVSKEATEHIHKFDRIEGSNEVCVRASLGRPAGAGAMDAEPSVGRRGTSQLRNGSCMKIALVTDAWTPQVNGVVTTLVELVRQLSGIGHEVRVIHPGQFKTRPCPATRASTWRSRHSSRWPDHWTSSSPTPSTWPPRGRWAGRRYCLRRKFAFTTAFHTKFPEIAHAAVKVPVCWGYALFGVSSFSVQ